MIYVDNTLNKQKEYEKLSKKRFPEINIKVLSLMSKIDIFLQLKARKKFTMRVEGGVLFRFNHRDSLILPAQQEQKRTGQI